MAVVVAALLALAGCAPANGDDTAAIAERLAEGTELNGAVVEVQHPGLPTNEKIVIWMFVDDVTPESVADDVEQVARVAADDPDLGAKDLTLAAVEGEPEDFSDRVVLGSSGARVMSQVAGIVGGEGAEEFLTLRADDVRRLAGE